MLPPMWVICPPTMCSAGGASATTALHCGRHAPLEPADAVLTMRLPNSHEPMMNGTTPATKPAQICQLGTSKGLGTYFAVAAAPATASAEAAAVEASMASAATAAAAAHTYAWQRGEAKVCVRRAAPRRHRGRGGN